MEKIKKEETGRVVLKNGGNSENQFYIKRYRTLLVPVILVFFNSVLLAHDSEGSPKVLLGSIISLLVGTYIFTLIKKNLSKIGTKSTIRTFFEYFLATLLSVLVMVLFFSALAYIMVLN